MSAAPEFVNLITSPNGINWSIVPNPFASSSVEALGSGIASDGINIVVAMDSPLPTGEVLLVSHDGGHSWTPTHSGFDNFEALTVAYLNGVFAAGGQGDNPSSCLVTSADGGYTWTTQSTPFDVIIPGSYRYFQIVNWITVDSLNRQFVAVGVSASGTNVGPDYNVMVSPDGYNWTGGTITVNGRVVLLDRGGSVIAGGPRGTLGVVSFVQYPSTYTVVFSTDGLSWSVIYDESGFTPGAIPYGVAAQANGYYFLCPDNRTFDMPSIPSALYYTVDPSSISNFTPLVTPWDNGIGEVQYVAYHDGLYVACGDTNPYARCVMTSPDLRTWTVQHTPMDNTNSSLPPVGLQVIWAAGYWWVTGTGQFIGPTIPPPTRQFPRDDNLALGAPRQRVGPAQPTSRQSSYRQGFRGTYT